MAPGRVRFAMALYYDLPVYQDVYKIILMILEYSRDFPREYTYTSGQDIKRNGIVLIRSIDRANKSADKESDLERFMDDFDILKVQADGS